MGALIFLISASVAFFFHNESLAQIDLSRAENTQSTLIFISQAILADSYNTLLQSEFEKLTLEFLEATDTEPHYVNPTGDWKENLADGLAKKYGSGMKSGIGADASLYAHAYSEYAGIDYCDVKSSPSVAPLFLHTVFESEKNDGTIKAKAYSYGESVECVSRDPEGRTEVEILGKYYQIDIRLIGLFDMAKFSVIKARDGLDYGSDFLPDAPTAHWKSSKWYRVDAVQNKVFLPLGATRREEPYSMGELVKDWVAKAETFSRLLIQKTMQEAQLRNYRDMYLDSFTVRAEDGNYDIGDFEVSCVRDENGISGNCMPDFTYIVIGDKECMDGGKRLHENVPYYKVEGSHKAKSGSTTTKGYIEEFLTDILSPLGYACYYIDRLSYAAEVCNEWEAKPIAAVFEGSVVDGDPSYNPGASSQATFNFVGRSPSVKTDDIRGNVLKCSSGGYEKGIWESNIRELLSGLELKVKSQKSGSFYTWTNDGSKINDGVLGERLKSMYNNVIAEAKEQTSFVPVVEFEGGSRIENTEKVSDVPTARVDVEWSEVLARCIGEVGKPKVDILCTKLCSGSGYTTGIAKERRQFCEDLVRDGNTDGLVCECTLPKDPSRPQSLETAWSINAEFTLMK
ncbi:MAG: hypothetical protein JXB14_02005 [Candidatus Altiarchaeota archaeon]|nr:hypothetical protein [Candidatus Altiarchaeota archaeon]